jgi:hypothetical protein
MPAYNFRAQFAPLVESGAKRQTIRSSARGACPGGTAYLYTGQRTKRCRKLGEGTITAVLPIKIARDACGEPYACITQLNGQLTQLVHRDLDMLAKADGFEHGSSFVDWFEAQYGLPFAGYLHQWDPRRTSPNAA